MGLDSDNRKVNRVGARVALLFVIGFGLRQTALREREPPLAVPVGAPEPGGSKAVAQLPEAVKSVKATVNPIEREIG